MDKLTCIRATNGSLRYYSNGKPIAANKLTTDQKSRIPIQFAKRCRRPFSVVLPIDVIVMILSCHPRLLGMAHYLSKEIATISRPFRLRLLMSKPFTIKEMTAVPIPCGMYGTRNISETKSCNPYAFVRLGGNSIWRVIVGPADNILYWIDRAVCKDYIANLHYYQPDLYTCGRLYQRRGQERKDLLQKILEDRYNRPRNLENVIALHAFLAMHRVLQGKVVYGRNWQLPRDLTGSVIEMVQEIEEWYPLVKESLR